MAVQRKVAPSAPVDDEWSEVAAASAQRLRHMMGAPLAAPRPYVLERDGGDEGDVAQVAVEGHLAEGLSAISASLQERINRALDRLEVGRYGICEDCGQRIPAARLEFAPESTRCVGCQARADRMA